MRPMFDDGGGGGGWDLRNPRRNAIGMGANIPVTLDGTGSGDLYHPTAPLAPPSTSPMNMPVSLAGPAFGLSGSTDMADPISPTMAARALRPRRLGGDGSGSGGGGW